MKQFLYYMFGFFVGYVVGIWQTNNKWIWASTASNLRNFCRKRRYSVKNEGEEDFEALVSACYKGRLK